MNERYYGSRCQWSAYDIYSHQSLYSGDLGRNNNHPRRPRVPRPQYIDPYCDTSRFYLLAEMLPTIPDGTIFHAIY